MMPDAAAKPKFLAIKKYPNRRFYDSTRSCHVTLEDIHELIRAGHQVQVTDSKLDKDITSEVLAQIILEMDSRKLGMFPQSLLHQVIQSNEALVHEFVDVYFNQAFEWFLQARQLYQQQLRQSVGLGEDTQDSDKAVNPWPSLIAAFGPPPPQAGDRQPVAEEEATAEIKDLYQRIAHLTRRMEKLQTRLPTNVTE
jgi:polyhydroxyalkanoate synthesis repressor PhaR